MSKNVQISEILVREPNVIQVDGTIYPRTKWNIEVVQKYWQNGDEAELDNLKNFSLDI